MLGFRLAALVVGVGLMAGVCGCGSKAAAKPTVEQSSAASLIKPGPGLFRSHEFRSTLQALPGWSRVMNVAAAETKAFYDCRPQKETCSAAAMSWQKIIRQVRDLPQMDQLEQVNIFFNRWPYRLDIDVYGVSDYWATPGEFLKLSGDCEDYCIIKYYALRELGFDTDSLRIVLLRDNIRNISHAVLAVQLNDQTYILDNLSNLVLSHRRYEHYVPQYSVNESYRWAHVSPNTVQ